MSHSPVLTASTGSSQSAPLSAIGSAPHIKRDPLLMKSGSLIVNFEHTSTGSSGLLERGYRYSILIRN